jgi:NAD-dependent deacetylase
MKKLVVLTGAGISAESGIRTFRDMGGLWEEYDVMEVASPEGWAKNPGLVLEFYNQRRRQLKEVKPNNGHLGLVELESFFEVTIITQNVDDLHERAGSSRIIHLHGELKKVRSTKNPHDIYTLEGTDLNPGDLCASGSQLRPHIVWFGEPVPAMEDAIPFFRNADYCAVIGTSLNVYPAAGLTGYLPPSTPLFMIDPHPARISYLNHVIYYAEPASSGVSKMKADLLKLIQQD